MPKESRLPFDNINHDSANQQLQPTSIVDQQPRALAIEGIIVDQPDGSRKILPGRYMTADEVELIEAALADAARARAQGWRGTDLDEWVEKGESVWEDNKGTSE